MCLDPSKITRIRGNYPILAFRKMEIKRLRVGKGITHARSYLREEKIIIRKNGKADYAQLLSNSPTDYGYHSSNMPEFSITKNQWLVLIPSPYLLYTDGQDITSISFYLLTKLPNEVILFHNITVALSTYPFMNASDLFVNENSIIVTDMDSNKTNLILPHTSSLKKFLSYIDPRQRRLLERKGA